MEQPRFESAVSGEFVAQLANFPTLKKVLVGVLQEVAHRPKIVEIDDPGPREEEQMLDAAEKTPGSGARRRAHAMLHDMNTNERMHYLTKYIKAGKFTTSTDKEKVATLYQEYSKTISLTMTRALRGGAVGKYKGDRNADGNPHGDGWELNDAGDLHRANWLNGVRRGQCSIRFASDGVLSNCEYTETKRNGFALFFDANGALYRNFYRNHDRVREDSVLLCDKYSQRGGAPKSP